LQSTLNLGGSGASWDHIDYDPARHLAYLSRRADGLTVVDVTTGKVVAEVANAKGSGATALAPKLDRGFTANTDGSTSVFKLSDFSPVDRISFGDNFDGVVYDEATNILAYQQADDSKELLVDASTLKLVGTIEVEGKELERPVVDGKSNLYLPIRDKHLVYKIDLKAKKIVARWDVSAKCTQPSGSEFDVLNNRVLLPCRGMITAPTLTVVDAETGAVTATAPTGRGADDLILDPATKQLFVANGVDGNLNVFRQEGADQYRLTETFQTRPGMRVIRYDASTQRIFGMTAEGTFDASKKTNTAISPFYPNTFFPGTFVMLTYGRGPAAK
jgi:DNA-binding beta-propeller fold protein YncE